MAAIVHRGPVEECRTTYERLFAWLDANHLPVTGPIREVYLNDPAMSCKKISSRRSMYRSDDQFRFPTRHDQSETY